MKAASRWPLFALLLLCIAIAGELVGLLTASWLSRTTSIQPPVFSSVVDNAQIRLGLRDRHIGWDSGINHPDVRTSVSDLSDSDQTDISSYDTVAKISEGFAIASIALTGLAILCNAAAALFWTRSNLSGAVGTTLLAFVTGLVAWATFVGQRPHGISGGWDQYSLDWSFWLFFAGSVVLLPAIPVQYAARRAIGRDMEQQKEPSSAFCSGYRTAVV